MECLGGESRLNVKFGAIPLILTLTWDNNDNIGIIFGLLTDVLYV